MFRKIMLLELATGLLALHANIRSAALPPIFDAVSKNRLAEAARLLDEGEPSDFTDESGRNILQTAICNRNAEMVRMLLQRKEGRRLIDSASGSGRSILHYAASSSNGEIMQMLLATEARRLINYREKYDKQTPLHEALEYRTPNYKVVCALLDAGANPNIPDMHRNTALHSAIHNEKCKEGIVKKLLRAGALADAPGSHGNTPLHSAHNLASTHALLAYHVPHRWNNIDLSALVAMLLGTNPHLIFQCFDKDGKAVKVTTWDGLPKALPETSSILHTGCPLLDDIMDLAGVSYEELEAMENPRRRVCEMLNKRNERGQTALELAAEQYAQTPPFSTWRDPDPGFHRKFLWQDKIKEKRDFLSALHEELE